MKLMINTAHQRFGGAVQVALSFINECRAFPEHEYFVMLGPGLQKLVNEAEFPDNFHFEKFDFGAINFRKSFAIHKAMKAMEMKYKPDVVISTTGPSYFHSKAPQIIGYNLPLYIYPESPFIMAQPPLRKLKRFFKKQIHFYYFKRDATHYVVQTNDVNQRVRKALRTNKVLTVSNNASGYYMNWEVYPNRLPQKGSEVFRFLTISSYYKHKNLEIIPQVLASLRERGVYNVEFVLTLNEDDFIRRIGNMEGLHNVGPIKPPECPSLYQECDGMFLPTLAECFSASYPEAMIMGKPIITTDLGFARSICGDAALYFEPKNANAAANEIVKLLNNRALQSELVENAKSQLEIFDTPKERAEKFIHLAEGLLHAV